jgi:hypothetical protein
LGDRNSSPLSMPASLHCPSASTSQPHFESGALHRQVRELGFDLLARTSARLAPTGGQCPGGAQKRLAGIGELLLDLGDRRLSAVNAVCSAASRSRCAIASSSVPPCLRLRRSISASRSSTCLQTLRRRIDAAGEVAKREREVIELRLDAVARVEVRREPRSRSRRAR